MIQTDVLVIGAGPAGSAAAIVLARAGWRVLLADRSEFPRDKVCGDALIPDSLAVIQKLNLGNDLRQGARLLTGLSVFAPNGTEVRLRGRFACQPRRQFDLMLQREAVNAGVTFHAPLTVRGPRLSAGRVVGATFASAEEGRPIDVESAVTLLATGAAAQPLQRFDVCTRLEPSAMAARAYFRLPSDLAEQHQSLVISYDRAICPGYGWIFPGPDNVCNVGVGVFRDAGNGAGIPSLAAGIAARGERLTELKGAPLRTAMTGARLHRPGLLVLGEAAGLTFSFSGEGIGKAMESGIIAGDVVNDVLGRREPVEELGPRYHAIVHDRFSRVFRNYRRVQDWLAWPSVCNLLAWRANRSPFVREQLEGMLSESVDPAALFSLSRLISFSR
jgi:geranylgeranyl reductase family protein